jgi:hypothetical protein
MLNIETLLLKVLVRFNLECSTEELLWSLFRIVDVGVYSVTSKPYFFIGLLCNGHAKV